MPFEDAAAEIERMKRDLGVELDRDLAIQLGIDPTAISAWRRRARVPAKYAVRFSRLRDEKAWSYGKAASTAPLEGALREAYVFSLIALAAQIAGDQPLGAGQDFDATWLGFRLARLHEHLRGYFASFAGKDALRTAFETKRDEMRELDLLIWLETL